MDPVASLTTAVEETAAELAGNGRRAGLKLDRPPRADFGDYSTNAAMLLAPSLGEPPRAVAERLGDRLGERLGETVERVEIAGPGFLNLFMADSWYLDTLATLVEAGDRYGAGSGGEHLNVEFVSANPTGPITIASARHAAYGDSLARILERAGHRVEREYYVNDAGSQVRALRRVDPGARPRRGAAGGRLPGRLRARAGRADRRRGRRRSRRAGAARHRADARGRARLARALPRAHGRVLLGARAPRGRRDRGRDRAARRRRLRARRRALAAHDRARRRQGPRAAPLERRVDLLRLGHRLPRHKIGRELRPRDRHLGRGPPRPHRAHAGRLAGARRRSGRATRS